MLNTEDKIQTVRDGTSDSMDPRRSLVQVSTDRDFKYKCKKKLTKHDVPCTNEEDIEGLAAARCWGSSEAAISQR